MESSGSKEQQGPETRIAEIEQRIAKIEAFLNLNKQARASEQGSVPAAPPKPVALAAPSAGAASAAQPRYPLEDRAPAAVPGRTAVAAPKPRYGNWLGVTAVFCFVLAAGFIIKLSIESGWLTHEKQIGLAILFGFALIAAGLATAERDREYSSLLPGAGVIVLYLAVFAAHRFYSMIPFEQAMVLVSAVSGLCIWLYTRIREDVYPVTAAIGSYLAPVIMGLGSFTVFTVYYYLLCSLAFATISVWVQSRALTLVASCLAIVMTAFIGLGLDRDILIASMLAVNFLVFSTGTYLYTMVAGTPLTEKEANWFFPALVIFYAMEYHYLHRIQPDLAPWLSLGFAAFLIGLYLSVKKWFPEGGIASGPMIVAFAAIVCFHSFYLEILPDDIRPWLFVAIALVAAVYGVSFAVGAGAPDIRNSLYIIPVVAVFGILAIEYVGMAWHLLSGKETGWLAVSMWSVGSLWVFIFSRGAEVKEREGYVLLLSSAHLLAILAFYRLTTDISSLAVSASWLVYAVAVITFAFNRKDEAMAKSATFVLGFAAGKALLYDAASAPTVVRITCLMLTGAVLYGAGFFFRMISAWKTEPAAPAKEA